MTEIINIKQTEKIGQKMRQSNLRLVLAGGCFDILHIGHIRFLQEAKKMGDKLILILESDAKVKKEKGRNRPYFSQKDRLEVLSCLTMVDYVLPLKQIIKDKDYDSLITSLNPQVITATENDPRLSIKRKQAQSVKASLRIIPFFKTVSSSKIARNIGVE